MTDKKTKALKLALEALEKMGRVMKQSPDTQKAITAIREALAEQPAQQQEPVITKNEKGLTLHVGWDDLPAGTKLYTSPPANKQWVGLTREDWAAIGCKTKNEMFVGLDVAAKLREKNTGETK